MDRPLPYLIGSLAFMEQDDVGLGDLSSDGKVLINTDDSLCRHSHNVVYISNNVFLPLSFQKCQLTVTGTV